MAPCLEDIWQTMCWKPNPSLLKKMQAANAMKLGTLDATLEDAEQNLGETEVRDALLRKAEHLCRIGDKDCVAVFRKAFDKSIELGHRLDIIFHLIRVGLFWLDKDLITQNIDKAKDMIDEGGDWDRRNRLKVYQGVYKMYVGDFKSAAQFFLDTVSTFTSYELMDYTEFVSYTVIVSMISLDRSELGKKVVDEVEIQKVLSGLPDMRNFLFSLYNCHYAEFFKLLAVVETKLKLDRLMRPHYRYYVTEMRIIAYTQLLESCQSLTIQSMAEEFGVSVDFIHEDLSRFIADGRLHCKIDEVGGIVETNCPDSENYQYQGFSSVLEAAHLRVHQSVLRNWGVMVDYENGVEGLQLDH